MPSPVLLRKSHTLWKLPQAMPNKKNGVAPDYQRDAEYGTIPPSVKQAAVKPDNLCGVSP